MPSTSPRTRLWISASASSGSSGVPGVAGLVRGAKAALLAGVHRSPFSVAGRLQDTAVVMKVGSMPRSELTKKYDLVVVGGG